jgi:hypothetical protein
MLYLCSYSVLQVALVGPHTRTTIDLAGNYFEDICPQSDTDNSCVTTMEHAMQAALTKALAPVGGAGTVTAVPGCKDTHCDPVGTDGFKEAAAAAAGSDAIVLALGLCGRPKIFERTEAQRRSMAMGDADGTVRCT